MPVTKNIFPKIPFIRITSLFLLGILLNYYLTLDLRLTAVLLTILIAVLLTLWHNSNYSGVKIQNLLISSGIILTAFFYPSKTPETQLPSLRKDYYLAEVCQKPAEKPKTFQTILKITSIALPKPEKVIAYFSKEKFDSTLTTGDQLIILTKPQEIRNMGNPFEFDYRSLMKRSDICFSVYLPYGTYLKTGRQSKHLLYWGEQFRDKLITILATVLPDKEERAVVSALTLGYRAEIDKDTIDYFASTGAMHVLSVSGLHVALIYYILGFLLAFAKRGKAGSIVFSIMMILFLWIYAFITGFSPSVQRATVMFTFVIIGNSLRRPVNIYNSLTASALFLILLNPNVIFDIGFQLSYLAVLGIVLIHPKLNALLEVTNPLLKWSWGLVTVSVAAQLMTFPLGLFYFNQFPNLFWLSNFVVIPATTLIIWLTLAFFVVSPVHPLSIIIGTIIQKITGIMLDLLKWIDSLPLAVTKGIVLSPLQVVLLFGCILALIIWSYSKKKAWVFTTLLLVVLFQTAELINKHKLFNQNAMIVYNTKNLMVHLISGRENYLVTTSFQELSEHERSTFEKVGVHLKLNRPKIISLDHSGQIKLNGLFKRENTILFGHSTITFITEKKNSRTPDRIDLTINTNKSSSRSIYIDKLSSVGKDIGQSFQLRRQGAFYANLNPK